MCQGLSGEGCILGLLGAVFLRCCKGKFEMILSGLMKNDTKSKL